MTFEEVIEYNLRDGGTAVTIFADAQTDRVNKARDIITKLLPECPERATIWELGCSAGDISGYFSEDHDCLGVDVVPAAVAACRERYPRLGVLLSPVEEIKPQPCDILVLCEFLEHVINPVKLVLDWLPLAKFVVIGHPLVRDKWDAEPGHLWAYREEDFENWFPLGGHKLGEAWTFGMYDLDMVIGWGKRI
jgi:hypothetical protein